MEQTLYSKLNLISANTNEISVRNFKYLQKHNIWT